jgi:hypothetical protein
MAKGIIIMKEVRCPSEIRFTYAPSGLPLVRLPKRRHNKLSLLTNRVNHSYPWLLPEVLL